MRRRGRVGCGESGADKPHYRNPAPDDPVQARDCAGGNRERRPNYDGVDLSRVTGFRSANLTWDFIRRLHDTTRIGSGFRCGTDIVKGLAMGARGVCIGRPYLK
jgi:hypothetical protein